MIFDCSRPRADYKAELDRLERTSPVVCAVMTYYRQGDLAYEQALEIMVIGLAEDAEKYRRQLLDYMMKTPEHLVILTPDQ